MPCGHGFFQIRFLLRLISCLAEVRSIALVQIIVIFIVAIGIIIIRVIIAVGFFLGAEARRK